MKYEENAEYLNMIFQQRLLSFIFKQGKKYSTTLNLTPWCEVT